MPRNVEIKARVNDLQMLQARIRQIAENPAEIIDQEDIFFPVASGRLKLRILAPDQGQLIFYERIDDTGPKTSHYQIAPTGVPRALQAVLTAAYGAGPTVRKRRFLYLVGRTRIHLDQVENLGDFIELEVVLGETEDVASGQVEAQQLLDRLEITSDQLIAGAYVDLLRSA